MDHEKRDYAKALVSDLKARNTNVVAVVVLVVVVVVEGKQ